MQKNLYTSLIVVFTLLSFQSFSQLVVPNGGFENYSEASGPNKFSPWVGTFVGNETEASTDAHSGKAALKLFNNTFGDTFGGRISCKINNSGTAYPLKLKGFVKYAVATGEKVKISVSTAYTRATGSQTTTYMEPIGWMTFTGTASAYQPFEIVFDYKLSDKVFYEKSNIEQFLIEIESFDEDKPYGTKLSKSTYIMVDDLAFEGNSNQLPRFTEGISDGLENWKTMDKLLYPDEWVNGSGLDEKFTRNISRSSEAAEGLYSLKMSVDTLKENYSIFGDKKIIVSDAKKKLSLKIKYNLEKGDSLIFYLVGKGFSPLVVAFKNTDLKLSNFREEQISLDKFKNGDTCFFILQLKKQSPISFKTFVLIDDLKLIDGNSLGTMGDVSSAKDLQVYPNPSASGVFTISTNDRSSIQVLDMFGNTVDFSTVSSNEKTNIDLGGNPPGLYLLKVDNFEIKKLVY